MEDVDHFFKNNYFMIEVNEQSIDVANIESPIKDIQKVVLMENLNTNFGRS